MKIIIDGKTCEAQAGQYIMEIAGQNGIEIPALCHHDALPGQACCRLCIVEIESKEAHRRVVVSCVYPVDKEITVFTRSENIVKLRKSILALLKAQAPHAEGAFPAYCLEYGVSIKRFHSCATRKNKCILCGLCTRACEELGNSSIRTVSRGTNKAVSTAFGEPSPNCIGCAACARVCPVNAIELLDEHNIRTIWGKTFSLIACADCGKPFATYEELEWLKDRILDAELNLSYCPTCRRRACLSSIIAKENRRT